MSEVGKVISADEDRVVVSMTRTEACAKCRMCVVGMSAEQMLVTAVNECGAQPGDEVEVELRTGFFARAVVLSYGFPLLMFFAGILGGQLFELGEPVSFAIALGLVFVSYAFIHFSKIGKNPNYKPVAAKIIK